MDTENQFLEKAIELAKENAIKGGNPFGAVLVKNGEIIVESVNKMLETCDPTSHAELNALREASKKLQTIKLEDCEVYASGQPCPMCLAAMRIAGIKKIVFALSNEQAMPYGLSTAKAAEDLRPTLENQTWAEIQHKNLDPDAKLYQQWQSINKHKTK